MSAPEPSTHGHEGKTIFIIDDEPIVLMASKLALKALNLRILTFDQPEEALNRLDEESPHIVLLDLNMPSITGHEWMVRLSEERRMNDFHLIVLTGDSVNEKLSYGLMSMGAIDVLQKPIEAKRLREKVLEILGEEL